MRRTLAPIITLLTALHGLDARDIEWVKDDVVQKGKQATVLIRLQSKVGMSGFFASSDGLVVTLASYLEGESGISVRTYTNEEVRNCKLLAIDQTHNLAVLSTGKKPPAYLQVHDQPVSSGSPCALVYKGSDEATAFDVVALVRREAPFVAEMGNIVCWSIAMNPSIGGMTGGPLISQEGKVVALCANVAPVGGKYPQRFVFGVPETAISSLLLQAKEAKGPMSFPKPVERGSEPPLLGPLFQEGVRLYAAGDLSGALQQLRGALREHPRSGIVLYNMATCMLEMGKPKEARELIDRAVKLYPSNLTYRGSLAEIIAAGGDVEEGIQCWKALTKDSPKYGLAWFRLAALQRSTGRKEEALEASKMAAELDPDSIQVWQLHADILLMAGQFNESSAARDRATDLESLYFKLKYSAPKRQ